MRRSSRQKLCWRATSAALALSAGLAGQAQAEVAPEDVREIKAQLAEQARVLEEQQRLLTEQGRELERLRQGRLSDLGSVRAGAASSSLDRLMAFAQGPEDGDPRGGAAAVPARPVGEAPAEAAASEVAALPEGMGVLTPRGRLLLDPSIEYTRSNANRLVFRGVEIVPGVQLGVIEANEAARDAIVGTAGVRYGLSDRLELEARVPYVYRRDRITVVAQRDETVSRTMNLGGEGLGDVEFAARYQLNAGLNGSPVFVGNLRVKTPTGTGPFDVSYDEFGVATELATGSGFWAVEPGVTMLLPSDPVVIFGNLSYLHSFERDVNQVIGGALVGAVTPGDSIGAGLGFGFSLNPRFSFSLGYRHNYIFPTETELDTTTQRSNSLSLGALLFGMSYRLNQRTTMSGNFEFGVTGEAPDVRMVLRLPFQM
jgi:hypothetical protein